MTKLIDPTARLMADPEFRQEYLHQVHVPYFRDNVNLLAALERRP